MGNQQLHAIVRGIVQMVGFRAFVEGRAARLGLVGYVRNTPDGSVEVVAEGPPERLHVLLADLRRGPPGAAEVEAVDFWWSEATGKFRFFRVGG